MNLIMRTAAARALAVLVAVVVLPLAAGATSRQAQAATSGLVAAYSFDEGSGTTVADASGLANTGTVQNATWSSAGKYGGALSFNGTSSIVTVPDAASLDLTTGMTLEAWVNPGVAGSSWRNILFKQLGAGMTYSLYASEGTGYSDAQVNIGGEKNAVDPWLTPLGSWTYFAATYDGSNLRLWANGANIQTTAVSGTISASTGPLTIGGNNVWPEWFQGLIDNVRVYNRALSAAEIQSDMSTAVATAPAPPPPPPPPPPTSAGPVAAYSFDEGSGTTVADTSGQGNTGTVTNATWSAAGKFGSALSFNGTSSLVSVPDAPELDLTTGMTLEAWVDPVATSGMRSILFKKMGTGMTYALYGSEGNGYSDAQVNIGGTKHAVDPWLTPMGSWTYFAVTYDGSNLRLWANGVNIQTTAVSGTLATSTGPLTIGGNTVWPEWFQGLIDNVRVYNRALSGTEIQADMNSAVPAASPPPPPPPSGDTQAPTAPTNVAVTGATQTSVSLSWTASSDNVGVAGYGVYRNGVSSGTSTSPAYTVTGLACGTTYTLSVDAYDAAGNRSAKSSTAAATSACPPTSANVFLSPSGNDGNPCTQSAPCASMDRGYHAAAAGQTVQLAAGTYGYQTINTDSSKTSATDVVFRPAAGAAVTVNGIAVYGSHITIQDMDVNGSWDTYYGTDDVTFRNLDVNGGIFTQSSSNISVIGGSVGPMTDTKPQFGNWPMNTTNRNLLVDGVTFHDIRRTSTAVHIECLLVGGTIGFTLRNSRFFNCDVFDISIGMMNGSEPPQNVVIENNFFGTAGSGGYYSLDFNDNTTSLTNVTVRNNSATQEMSLANGIATVTNFVVTGNVAPLSPWACDGRVQYSWNVFQGGTCGSTDINAPAGFKNAATLDLHLVPGAVAINRGNPSNYPSTDIDGQARPLGGAPDAGADEAG